MSKRGKQEPQPLSPEQVAALDDVALLNLYTSNANHWDWSTTASETRNAELILKHTRAEILSRMQRVRA